MGGEGGVNNQIVHNIDKEEVNFIYKMVFGCNVNFDSICLVRHINKI